MLQSPIKAFAILLGTTAVVGTGAYVSGSLDRFINAPPQQAALQPADPAKLMPTTPAPTNAPATAPSVETPAAVTPNAPAPATSDAPAATAPQQEVIAPSFDVVRAEADGSLVIAGKAAPGSSIEIISGATVLGTAIATPEGDFAVVLDNPLKPGDYQIVLRATGSDSVVATSTETAIVSIPDRKDGQVLALVEKPGEPSRLITVPEGEPLAAPSTAVAQQPAPSETGQPAAAATEQVAAAPAQVQPAAATPAVPAKAETVAVKAVEIEGNRVFVAGVAKPGGLVRVYANDVLLGETRASPTGEFLVETIRDLAVGDYIVRADLIGPNSRDVLARAQVPFRRLEGEAVAAVAPTVPPTNAPAAATPPAAGEAGSSVVAAPETSLPASSKAGSNVDGGIQTEQHAALEAVNNGVIIRRGDTLWRISKRVYGRGVRYSTIYLANQEQISDPNRIWPGQVFSVPGKTVEGENADMEAIGDQKATVDPAKPAAAAESGGASVVR